MVDTVYWLPNAYIGGPVAQVGWLGPKVSGHLAPFLYSSHELGELSQWLCHEDSTINTAMVRDRETERVSQKRMAYFITANQFYDFQKMSYGTMALSINPVTIIISIICTS